MGYLFLIAALLLNAGANLLLKAGADRMDGASLSVQTVLGNPHLLAGLVMFAFNVLFYVAALSRLNLSVAYPVMMAGGLLIVVAASVLLFGETLRPQQVAGIPVLVVGMVLVTYGTPG